MLATYRVTTIPIGALKRDSAREAIGIPFSYVVDVEFSSSAQLTSSDIHRVLVANPLWSPNSGLVAILTNREGIRLNAKYLSLTEINAEVHLARLRQYYLGSQKFATSGVTPSARRHDPRFDRLESGQVLDLAKLFRDVVIGRAALALRFAALINQSSNIAPGPGSRFSAAVHECAGIYSAIMRREIAAAGIDSVATLRTLSGVRGDGRTPEAKMLNELLQGVFSELSKFEAIREEKRYRPRNLYTSSQNEGTVPAEDLKANLAARDPNTLTAALLRDPALSRALGLVGRGIAWFEAASIDEDAESKFRLSVSNPGADASIVVEKSVDTAIRLSRNFVSLRPRAQDSRHQLLMWLNTSEGEERYKATVVNADHEVQKAWLMGRPSASPPRTSDQESMAEAGISQMTSPGVVFSAPPEDIIAPTAGSSPSELLYHEDLLIGYRIDIAPKQRPYYSLHEQQSIYSLEGFSEIFVSTRSESFADREQLTPNGYMTTDFSVWNGIGAAQAVPWRKLDATINQDYDVPQLIVREETSVPGTLPRLEYAQTYSYRLRPVFQGGTGPDKQEADEFLEGLDGKQRALYEQTFFYPRPNHFSAGVVVLPTIGKSDGSTNGFLYVADRGHNRARTVYVMPSALTIEEARFHGLFGRTIADDEALRDVCIVTDPKWLASPEAADGQRYFCDPDVEEVSVEVWEVGRPKDSMAVEVGAGHALELVPDVFVDRVILAFGEKGRWETFRPLIIEIRADLCTKTLIRKSGYGERSRSAEIKIPLGRTVEVRLVPRVRESARLTTAIPAHISQALGSEFSDDVKLMAETYERDEQVIAAMHVAIRPLHPPAIEAISVERLPDQSSGKLVSRIQVDAATTSDIEVLLSWQDVTMEADGMTEVTQERETKTGVRSIRFGREPFPLRSAISTARNLAEIYRTVNTGLDLSSKYYCENLVLYGEQAEAPTNSAVVDFPDGRRRTVTARVAAKARNVERIADFDSDARSTSAPVVFVLRNTIIPPPPLLRGVTTLRMDQSPKRHSNSGASSATKFAFSIEIAPRWQYTGEGERLAMAFHSDNANGSPFEAPVSRWGEDVFERPRLASTFRSPSPQDFVSVAGRHEYVSDLPLTYLAGEQLRTVSVDFATFELTPNRVEGFWSCDIEVSADFFGWLKLALFRYQPQSVEGRHLSRIPTWAFVRQFQERVLIVTKIDGLIELKVGPYSDATVSFDLCKINKVSTEMFSEMAIVAVLRRIRTDAGFTHYCRVRADGPLLLRQLRLGAAYDSVIIE